MSFVAPATSPCPRCLPPLPSPCCPGTCHAQMTATEAAWGSAHAVLSSSTDSGVARTLNRAHRSPQSLLGEGEGELTRPPRRRRGKSRWHRRPRRPLRPSRPPRPFLPPAVRAITTLQDVQRGVGRAPDGQSKSTMNDVSGGPTVSTTADRESERSISANTCRRTLKIPHCTRQQRPSAREASRITKRKSINAIQ